MAAPSRYLVVVEITNEDDGLEGFALLQYDHGQPMRLLPEIYGTRSTAHYERERFERWKRPADHWTEREGNMGGGG